jgi:hypothetical protein
MRILTLGEPLYTSCNYPVHVSIGIYNDPRPDHIACASTSRQKFWTLPRTEQTNRWMESQTDGWMNGQTKGMDKQLEQQTEKWPEEQPEKQPEEQPEGPEWGFP